MEGTGGAGKRIKNLLKEVERKDEEIETLAKEIQGQQQLVLSFEQEIALCREERRQWAEKEEDLLAKPLQEQIEELKRRLARAITMADNAETQAALAHANADIEKARREAAEAESIEMARAEEQQQRALAIEAAKSAAEATGEENSSESEVSDADDDEDPTFQPPTFAPSTSYQPPKYQPWLLQHQVQSTQQRTNLLYNSPSAAVLPATGTPTTALSAISPSAAKVFGVSLPSFSRSPIYTPSPSCSQQQAPHGPEVEVSSLSRPSVPGKPGLEMGYSVQQAPLKEYRDKCIGTESVPGKDYQDKSVGTEPVQGKEYTDKSVGTDFDVHTTPIPPAGEGGAMSIPAHGPIPDPEPMDLYRQDETMVDELESLPTLSVQPLSETPAPLLEGFEEISWSCPRGGLGRVTRRQLVPRRSKNLRDLVRITLDAAKHRGLVKAVFIDAIELSAQYSARILPVTRLEPGYVACEGQVPQQQPYTEQEVVSNEEPDSMSGVPTAQNSLPTIHQAEPEAPWADADGSKPGLGVFVSAADSPSGRSIPEITATTYQEVACQTAEPSMSSIGVQTAERPLTSCQTQTSEVPTTSSGTQTPEHPAATAAVQTEERPVISSGTQTQYAVESRACQTEAPSSPEIRVQRNNIVSELVKSSQHRIRMQTGLGVRNGRPRFTPAPLIKENEEHPAPQQGPLPAIQLIPVIQQVVRPYVDRQAQTDTDKLSGELRHQVSEHGGCRDRRWNWWVWISLALFVFLLVWLVNLRVEAQDCRLWFEANDVARRSVISRRGHLSPQPLWPFTPEHNFF